MNSFVGFRIAICSVVAALLAVDAAAAHGVLDVSTLTKYIDALPNPLTNVIAPSGMLDGVPLFEVGVSQFQQQLHSELPATTLWGYNGSYPGPTFDVNRDEAIKVRWTNNLVDSHGEPLHHFLPYDPTLHGADYPAGHLEEHGTEHIMHDAASDFPQARIVTHLHGGVVDEQSDGYPEHWFTPDPHAAPNGLGGPAGNSLITTYPNEQRAAGLWYHDHAMAITRLNVYAGMAGFYLIRDPLEAALNLPSGDYEIPLMIQDRSFFDNGSLFYPGGDEHDPEAPGTHVASFFADANLVNGKVWPYLEVEPRKYRFRLLNAANSRSYDLSLLPDDGAATTKPVTLHQIGTDGGLFSSRVERSHVGLAPADRADVVVDFSQFDVGDTLRLLNGAPGASDETTAQVMQFRIVPPTGADTSDLPDELVPVPRYQPEDAVFTRQIRLVRGFDSQGRERLLLDSKKWSDPISEIVHLGRPEIWEITNTTGENHPIHLHLESFQLLSRTAVGGFEIPLEESELGWEDTVLAKNGQVTRIMVNFEKYAGTFVWHCHILEHEDHEMMRPLRVVPEPSAVALMLLTMPVLLVWREPKTVQATR